MEEFLEWFRTTWQTAEQALHEGNAAPRFRTWSAREPVTLFGAWRSAVGSEAVREAFAAIAESFSGTVSAEIDLVAVEVSGELAYTAHREITSTTVDGVDRSYVLRVTQVYRRESREWKVVHRHGDEEAEPGAMKIDPGSAT